MCFFHQNHHQLPFGHSRVDNAGSITPAGCRFKHTQPWDFFSKGISEHRDTNVTVFDRETTEKLWQIAQTRALDEVLFIKYVVLYKAYESVFEVLSVSVCRQKKEPSKKIVDRLRKHLATFYCHLSDFDF